MEEIEQSRPVLVEARVPSPRTPRPKDEGQAAALVCVRCENEWNAPYKVVTEHIYPGCRSNSIRWLRV
jgi:hypothetical protein